MRPRGAPSLTKMEEEIAKLLNASNTDRGRLKMLLDEYLVKEDDDDSDPSSDDDSDIDDDTAGADPGGGGRAPPALDHLFFNKLFNYSKKKEIARNILWTLCTLI